jgi:riboflavin-specific deaminase-like protein
VVGSGTALADDPLLTVRHVPGPHPLRVVLDGRARVPGGAKLFTDATAPTLHVHRSGASFVTKPAAHVERLALPSGPGGAGVDLPSLLACLAQRGVSSVLVEGGSCVITSFLRAGLCDRLVVAVALLGAGVEAVGDLSTERVDHALGFCLERVVRLGDDLILDLVPRGPPDVGPRAAPSPGLPRSGRP